MRYIDIHAHTFPAAVAMRALPAMARASRLTPCGDGTNEGLRDALPSECLAVLQPVATRPGQAAHINAGLPEELQAFPTLRAFAALHPRDENLHQTCESLAKQGFCGIKLHSDYQHTPVEQMGDIFQAACDAGLYLLLHCGLDVGFPPPAACPPIALARMLDRYPGTKIIAAHMGGYCMPNAVEQYLIGRDIYLDTAMAPRGLDQETFNRLVTAHGPQRVLFGSDWPWGNPAEHLAMVQALPIDDEQKQAILYGNAAKILGE